MEPKKLLDKLEDLDKQIAQRILNEDHVPYGVHDDHGNIYGFEAMKGISPEDATFLNDWMECKMIQKKYTNIQLEAEKELLQLMIEYDLIDDDSRKEIITERMRELIKIFVSDIPDDSSIT